MENEFTIFSYPNGDTMIVRKSAILAIVPSKENPKKFAIMFDKDFLVPINEDLDLIQKKLDFPNPR